MQIVNQSFLLFSYRNIQKACSIHSSNCVVKLLKLPKLHQQTPAPYWQDPSRPLSDFAIGGRNRDEISISNCDQQASTHVLANSLNDTAQILDAAATTNIVSNDEFNSEEDRVVEKEGGDTPSIDSAMAQSHDDSDSD